MDEVKAAVDTVEKEMGKKFGDKDNTLLFSVRSGAAVSTLLCGCVCVGGWRSGVAASCLGIAQDVFCCFLALWCAVSVLL
jgi:hypothetical protein